MWKIALAALQFDARSPIVTSGHVTAAVWPEAGAGMIVVETGLKYAFSTAPAPVMAKEGQASPRPSRHHHHSRRHPRLCALTSPKPGLTHGASPALRMLH
jgi:hypothetical protein